MGPIDTQTEALTAFRDHSPETQREIIYMQNEEILAILAPLAPALAALPGLIEQVGPAVEALKGSPMLKVLGVKIPG